MHSLPRLHIRQLGFLEIGHHISLCQRHHCEDFTARCDVGADPHRALADHAVLRRDDPCIGQLVAGHFQLRLRPFQATFGCVALGRKYLHLLALRRQYRRGISQSRGGLIDARLRLLRILHRAGAHPGEVLVAVQFMLGKRHFRLGRNHRGLRLGNHRHLALEGRPGVLQLRPGHQRFGIGGIGGGA
ncbi:hypothetical protein D3C80_891140 [compost metagenome]